MNILSTLALPELLLVVMLGGGTAPADLVTLIDTEAYFNTHGLATDTPALMALAEMRPADDASPKSQVARLLAIRTLGERRELDARALLERIADAEDDPAGDYARAAVAWMLDKPFRWPVPKDRRRTDLATGLCSLPAETQTGVGILTRGAGWESPKAAEEVVAMIASARRSLPTPVRDAVHQTADSVGNIQIDRIVFGKCAEPAADGGRLLLRMAGYIPRAALTRKLQSLDTSIKADNDRENNLTILTVTPNGPRVVIFGETEIALVAAYHDDGNHRVAWSEFQERLTNPSSQTGLLRGRWADDLSKTPIPQDALAVLLLGVNELQAVKDLTRGEVQHAPTQAVVWTQADGDKLRVTAQLRFADQVTLTKFVAEMEKYRDKKLADLKHKAFGLPRSAQELTEAALMHLSLRSEGLVVTAETTFARRHIPGLPFVLMKLLF